MPETIAAALASYAGSAVTTGYLVAGYAITFAAVAAYSDYARKRANARARAASNASAKDRELMIRSAIAPRRFVYGRDRVSGPVFYAEVTGDKGQYLHLCVALAAHECDAIEAVYFNEDPLPAENGTTGFVESGDYVRPGKTQTVGHTGTTDGAGSITLPHNAVQVLGAFTETGTGNSYTQTHYEGWSHTGGSNTVTGLPVSTELTVQYTYQEASTPLVRIRKHLGSPSQTADADLVAESAGLWTTDHRAREVTYLYVRLEYDQDVFGAIGWPNISAVLRGKKLYDPRTDTTVWTENAALCVADWLKSQEGMRAVDAEVPDGEVTTAANISDEDIDLNLGGTETQPRYTCNTSFTTDQSPRDVLTEILGCMSGRAVWTQGRWLVRAGAYRTPTLTVTADTLAGPVKIMPRASRSELFNAVRATYRDVDQGYAEVQAPLVGNASYEAADGDVQIVRSFDIPTAADTYRAQRLCKIELERARQALTVELTLNLYAYDLAPTDTFLLTLGDYGFSAKPFEVLSRTISTDGTLQYVARETDPGVWDWNYGEATIGDLAPNTVLPSPFGPPPALTNFTATERAVLLGDGTVVTQALLEWDQSTSVFVVQGGYIDLQTARADQPFGSIRLPGDHTSILVGPLQAGVLYVARLRAVSADGKTSDWTYTTLTAEGLAAPPANVTGLTDTIVPGQVQLTWDVCPDADYADTELRVDGTGWDDATFLWRGSGTEYHHPRPANGTYTVRAKHRDRSGTYSTTAASISVTVDDSIDPGAPDSLFVEYSVDGSTLWHSTFTTGDLFARWKIGAAGAWNGPFRIVGETGAGGDYVDFIFKRASSQPATPTGSTPAGWYDAPPAADGNPLWASTATKTAAGVLIGVWSTPVQIEGDPGATGVQTAIVYAYRRATSTPSGPSVSSTYTFSTKSLTALNNSWVTTVPAGTDPLYVIAATASTAADDDTDSISSGEWSSPQQISGNDGAAGLNSATVFLYQRTSSATAPSLPGSTLTYTFATGVLSGTLGSWSQTIPASGGEYVHVTTATAISSATTDSISSGEWAAVRVLSSPGTAGSDGARGSLTGYGTQYGLYYSSSWADNSTGTSTQRANRVIDNMLNGTTLTTGLASTSHLRIGDTVTLTDAASATNAITKYWSGTGWITPGTVISGNLLVGGTISGELNINITGSASFEGASGISIPAPGSASPNVAYDAAVVTNSTLAQDIAVYGKSSSIAAIYGHNSSTNVTRVALYGYGPVGVYGYASVAGGNGVKGQGGGNSGTAGVHGINNGTGDGVRAEYTGFGGGNALRVVGPSTFSEQITSTVATGTAPLAVTSTTEVANLNVAQLKGKTWAVPDPIGATTPSTGRFTTLRVDAAPTASGANTATFSGLLPTGSAASTNSWAPINLNGTQYWIPVWVD